MDLTYDQSLRLAWWIMNMPSNRKLTINKITFCVDEIDLEAERKAKFPKQMGLGVRVKSVPVEKKRKKSIDFAV